MQRRFSGGADVILFFSQEKQMDPIGHGAAVMQIKVPPAVVDLRNNLQILQSTGVPITGE
jgi:hypothetical protein